MFEERTPVASYQLAEQITSRISSLASRALRQRPTRFRHCSIAPACPLSVKRMKIHSKRRAERLSTAGLGFEFRHLLFEFARAADQIWQLR